MAVKNGLKVVLGTDLVIRGVARGGPVGGVSNYGSKEEVLVCAPDAEYDPLWKQLKHALPGHQMH